MLADASSFETPTAGKDMLRMIIKSTLDVDGRYWTLEKPIEFDLQDIREKGICHMKARNGKTYTIGISNIWRPAEEYKLDYDAIISTPEICTLLWQYMVEATGERSGYATERAEISVVVDNKESFFPAFKRWDFWTAKYVAMISSVDEVKESEVFLVNFDLLPDPKPQIYMIGWASE